jgi:hypothetical protein
MPDASGAIGGALDNALAHQALPAVALLQEQLDAHGIGV